MFTQTNAQITLHIPAQFSDVRDEIRVREEIEVQFVTCSASISLHTSYVDLGET